MFEAKDAKPADQTTRTALMLLSMLFITSAVMKTFPDFRCYFRSWRK